MFCSVVLITFAKNTNNLGLNPGSAEIFFSILPSMWTVKRFSPSSAYGRDFANAVGGKGLS